MQPTPQEAMNMPQNGQVPMQTTAPVPQAMPASYGQNPSPNEQLSAAALARAQANILAQAIIEAQNFATNTPPAAQVTPPATPEMQPPAASDPTETQEQMNKVSSGERVIQPIHDPRIEQQREDMAKKMAELLGDEEYQPVQIDTNTAKHMQAAATMTVPNATQASEAIPQVMQQQQAMPQMQPQQMAPYQQIQQPDYQPTAQMQLAPTPQMQPQQMVQQPMPPQAASGQAIYSQMVQQPQFTNTSQNVMAQMQQPVALYQQIQNQQSMDPRAAAIKMQALQAEEERKMQVGQSEISQAEQEALAAQQEALQLQAQAQQARELANQKAEQEHKIEEQQKAEHDAEMAAKQAEEQKRAEALAAMQQPVTVEEDDDQPKTLFSQLRSRAQHTNMRVNPDVVKKAADATILVSQKTPPDEPVQAIQPAYIQALETELATDMQEKEKSSEVGSQMAAELANDQITLEASKIKVDTPKEEAESDAPDATPEAVLAAMQNVMASPNLESNPNIKNG